MFGCSGVGFQVSACYATDVREREPDKRSQRRRQKYEFGMGNAEVGIIRLRVSGYELKLHFPYALRPIGFALTF